MRLLRFTRDDSGSFTSTFALTFSMMLVMAGMAVDFSINRHAATNLQEIVDAAVLAGAATPGTDQDKIQAAREHFEASLSIERGYHKSAIGNFSISAQGVLSGSAAVETPMLITGAFLKGPLQAGVKSEALFGESASSPCINILGNQNQALMVNGGAIIQAPDCEVQIHSTRNPAMIMNGGSTLNVKKVCIAGDRFIRNGGSIGPIETNCAVSPDPYFRNIPEPAVSNVCTTSNNYNGGTYTIRAGVHCSPTFNGSPVLNFEPGLHIIKGRFIVNSGATINAPGVTFYFPDADSEIRANGSLTMVATAPTSGTYAGILMFEKTSDANNNRNKRQYIFNGSISERLEGLIYLPNRDVTYNSKTNVTGNKTTLYVNTMMINSAEWKLSPAGAGSAGADMVRLSK